MPDFKDRHEIQTAFEIADAWSEDCPENSPHREKLIFLKG